MLGHKNLIGHLDREIYFIKPIITDGDSNEDRIDGWELIDNYPMVNAKKFDGKGNSFVFNDRLTFTQLTEWTIRYRDDLNTRMRLVYNTQVYEILSISEMPEGRNRFLKVNTNLLDQIFFT
jgi:hypothetical protein